MIVLVSHSAEDLFRLVLLPMLLLRVFSKKIQIYSVVLPTLRQISNVFVRAEPSRKAKLFFVINIVEVSILHSGFI